MKFSLRVSPLLTRYSFDYEIIKPKTKQIEKLNSLISSKKEVKSEFKEYVQVFGNKFGFLPNLSILDLLFNLGPETKTYLNSIKLDLN